MKRLWASHVRVFLIQLPPPFPCRFHWGWPFLPPPFDGFNLLLQTDQLIETCKLASSSDGVCKVQAPGKLEDTGCFVGFACCLNKLDDRFIKFNFALVKLGGGQFVTKSISGKVNMYPFSSGSRMSYE